MKISPAVLIYLLALAPRLLGLGAEAFWYDEAFTATVTSLSPDKMLTALAGDVHPPLWYLIELAFGRSLGISEGVLRLPSALLGAGVVVLIFHIAQRLGLGRGAWIAALLAGVLPAALYYSQEARMYSLLACTVLAMVWACIEGRWGWFSAAGAAALYTHNLAIAYVAALGALAWLTGGRGARRAVTVAVGAWLPWAATVTMQQLALVQSGYLIPQLDLGRALLPFAMMTMGWRLPESLLMVAYGVSVAMTILGLWAVVPRLGQRNWQYLMAMVFGGPAVIAAASMLGQSLYLNRTMLPSGLGLCILWAAGLLSIKPKWARRALGGVVAAAVGIGMAAHYDPANAREKGVRELARIVNARAQPGDVLYFTDVNAAVAWSPYINLPKFYREAPRRPHHITPQTAQALGLTPAALDNVKGRVWIIIVMATFTDDGERADALAISQLPNVRYIHEIERRYLYLKEQ